MVSYTNSPLVQYTALTTKCNNRQSKDGLRYNPDGKIKKITIHHCAGKLSVKTIGRLFSPEGSRRASSTYGIGTDGRIAMYVEEKNRPWTSSSAENDYQAVTIEVSNCNLDPNWEVSDLCLSRLIELCIDICKRNEIPRLEWTGDKSGSLTSHDMFAATACPGPYLKSKFPYICEQVNRALSEDKEDDDNLNNPTATSTIDKGAELELNGVNLYASAIASRRSSTKTGKFWVWGSDVINSRVRITNTADRVGVKGQVTGYINYKDAVASIVKKVDEVTFQPLVDVPVISKGDRVVFSSTATKWATGERIPRWITQKILYVRSEPKDGKCQVSIFSVGLITGVAYVKDLKRR